MLTELRCFPSMLVLMAALAAGVAEDRLARGTVPEVAKPGPGPIVNIAADGLVGCLVPPFRIDGMQSKQELTGAFEKLVDHYARARVPYLFLNVNYQRTAYRSRVWDTYWDNDAPERLTEWPRLTWLVYKQGVDPYAVCVRRCRQDGISPWMSIRMNDTHYQNDPMKTSRLWQHHPELRRVDDRQWYCGFDFAHRRVREYYLSLIRELLDRYDCDGLELDWMRFPHHFRPGRARQGCRYLNDFMRRVRQLADAAAARRGHPVRIAARIPAVPEFAQGFGMDGVAWARDHLVDMLILSAEWRPSDTDIPIERWRRLIGPAMDRVLLVAATDLWLQGTPDGKVMAHDLATERGFTAAMLDRGADRIYLFNHFNMNDFRGLGPTRGGPTAAQEGHVAVLRIAGHMNAAVAGPRRHVVTFHDPAPPDATNPKPLPAVLEAGKKATFRIYTGPKPNSGRAVIRVGLAPLPAVAGVNLSARINGVLCAPLEDLARPRGKSSSHDSRRALHVADVARRILQFAAPRSAVVRGYNTVELSLPHGGRQRVIWLEIYLVP